MYDKTIMNDTTDSILESLDGQDRELFPFLPYLLQDLFEMGAFPERIAALVQQHGIVPHHVLDLGCGKGAVSIHFAKTFGCRVHGIDAMPEFIADAERWAATHRVEHLCQFDVGDIRRRVEELREYDLVILGSIGPIFGDVQATLAALRPCLTSGGYVILDDAYLPDDRKKDAEGMLTYAESVTQIRTSGFEIIADEIVPAEKMVETDNEMFANIERRAQELIAQHPEKAAIFKEYIEKQTAACQQLEEELICTTWLLRKC